MGLTRCVKRQFFLHLQATIALRAIVTCGISLNNAADASQSPQSSTPPAGRRSQGRLTESAVIAHAQQLQCDIHRGSTV